MIRTELLTNMQRTPAVKLAVRGQLEIIESGHGDEILMLQWDHNAILGWFDHEPVGVITFSHTKWVRQLDIHIGYVVPEHRGRGVYRAMWDRLVEEAQAREALVIWGNTHVDNAVMRATARSLGRVERGVLLRFDVPPKDA